MKTSRVFTMRVASWNSLQAESQDSGIVPDMTFPPVEVPDAGIVDLEFPNDNTVAVHQPLVDENESVGVLSRIRGWLGKE